MTINPCKATHESFTKFTSNALGDPYVDPGKYNASLRSSSCNGKPFVNMHGNRTVRKSEFPHMAEHKAKCPTPESKPGFYNRKTSEPFTNLNGIGYQLDPYERKQDLERDEYARLNSKILYQN